MNTLHLTIDFICSMPANKNESFGVRDPWFTLIREGLKVVEGRLNKGRFSKLNEGDIVHWEVTGKQKPRCTTTIINIVHYPSFDAMLRTETIERVLPGVPDVDSGVKVYRQFYTKEQERKLGVLAIHVAIQPNKRMRCTRKKK